jgi:hypothetical protein
MEAISNFWDIIFDRLPIVNKNLKESGRHRATACGMRLIRNSGTATNIVANRLKSKDLRGRGYPR